MQGPQMTGQQRHLRLSFVHTHAGSEAGKEPAAIVVAVVQQVLVGLKQVLQTDRHPKTRHVKTGTGCILLALLSEFPAATGLGVDIAVGTTMTARRNAVALGLTGRAHFVVGDWGTAISGGFDVIVSNPPYIARSALADLPHEVACYDPRLALDGGPDGLGACRSLVAELPELLKPGGVFACEVGMGQAPAVGAMLQASGLAIEGCERDLAGIARCLVARAPARSAQKVVGMRRLPV